MEIQDSDNNIVNVSDDSHLMVCMCKKTCDNHALLQELLDIDVKMLLYYRDKDNNIKPISEHRSMKAIIEDE